MKKRIIKYSLALLGTRAAGLYILLFAVTIGLATFIENDFGTSAAQKIVYKSWWFSLLLALFGGTILTNIFRYRMVQQKKWALLAFHAAIIVILIGAAVTRYFGYEGVMHIRENDQSSEFLSSESFLQFNVEKEGHRYSFDEEVVFASLGSNSWSESYLLGNDLIEVDVEEFIPNPARSIESSATGVPMLKIVFGGSNGREEYFLVEGQSKRIRNTLFNFSKQIIPDAINISLRDDQLLIKSEQPMSQTIMATQQKSTLLPEDGPHPLQLRALYAVGTDRFVFGDFRTDVTVKVYSEDQKVRRESLTALRINVKINGEPHVVYAYGQKGLPGRTVQIQSNGLNMSISYGAKPVKLPFAIHLHEFIMERYPGTENAASYASEVTLYDPRNGTQKDYRIYMNHILNYDGYRFFQSSFDRDEKGTYLSVNHDYWGSLISYIGYGMLTLGMILTLFHKGSRFYQVNKQLKQMRVAATAILLLITSNLNAQKVIEAENLSNGIQASHAEKFSKVIVQDHRGRMKPMHTLNREILRKVARKESVNGLNADQVVLGMFINKKDWYQVPMIKLGKHPELKKKLGITSEKARYSDFFEKNGSYKLRDEVRRAYSLEPIDRGTLEKELLKVDERVNILNMVFSGRMFRVIPVEGDRNNTWVANNHHGHNHTNGSSLTEKFFTSYSSAVRLGMQSGNYTQANQLLDELGQYQSQYGAAVAPTSSKINLEILLNKMNVFSRLAGFYALMGVGFLFFLFFSVFKPTANINIIFKIFFGLLLAGFLFHTLGLGLRWYVSGRAPWSNGYESMIYIAWTTALAGLIFTRKSWGGLAATTILSATILLVALLSHMDPEITPLVPVLKSYWLTIHVSLEAGSYGFLMLGAMIGIINLILLIFLTGENKDRVKRIVKEMTLLSEITLIGGLIMISTGTYLGGIWANESWGRYWGWDAKETWALVTILIYAFILHMRIIPKMYNLYSYNLATIFGLASVIMTYYGVNYYLSGLHSYAAGDPVPVPSWVYIMVTAIFGISVAAYWKKRKFKITV